MIQPVMAILSGQASLFAISADLIRALLIPSVILFALVVILIYSIMLLKRYQMRNPIAELDKEFRAEKDTLLILAEKKKQEREKAMKADEARMRVLEEMGEQSVNMPDYLGTECPNCLQPMAEDTEILVLLDCATAVHSVCFKDFLLLSPESKSRYVYLYPDGEFASWDDIKSRL
ncbi:MAG: hypothetical protein HRF49_02610 [bacterium]|jgi:phage shock protein PspC (stress-responsive transcriptional regulator)